MAIPNLSKLSSAELEKVIKKANQLIGKTKDQERKALKAKMRKLAAKNGMTLNEVLGIDSGKGKTNKAKQKVRAKVEPKYRNPENAEATWTGRGRKPLWVVDALAAGGSMDDLAI